MATTSCILWIATPVAVLRISPSLPWQRPALVTVRWNIPTETSCPGKPPADPLTHLTAVSSPDVIRRTDTNAYECSDPGYACSTHKLVASSGDPNPWTLIGCVAEGSGPITIFENRPGEAGQTSEPRPPARLRGPLQVANVSSPRGTARAGKETTQQRSTPTIPTKFGGKTGESGPGETAARKNSAVKGDTPAILSVTVAVLVSGWLVWTT